MATSKYNLIGRSGLPAAILSLNNLVPLFLFILAIIPRLAFTNQFVTPDEPIWVYRSLEFREALLSADWPNTIQAGHPGTTTTWLGAIGSQLTLWLQPDTKANLEWIKRLYWLSPDNGEAMQHLAHFLDNSRLMVILVASLGVPVIYILARRRIGLLGALLAALLLAFDPFIAGLGSLLHVDGLLALFMTVAVLLVLPRSRSLSEPGGSPASEQWLIPEPKQLIAAGIATGLAVMTKTPGLYLLVVVPLIALWPGSPFGVFGQRIKLLVYWGMAAAITALIVLPALWSAPAYVWELISGLAGRLAESGIRPTFFLGQLTLEPGVSFYPLVILFRLSPLVFLGVMSLLGWSVVRFLGRRPLGIPANISWLILYSLGFLLFLNLSTKKFDRYALPAIVSLSLVAGWALAFFYRRAVADTRLSWPTKVMFSLVLVGYFIAFWPYPLTAYNPLAGGPAVAVKVLPAGWGEGTSAGAEWSASMAEASERKLFTNNVPTAGSFFPGPIILAIMENVADIDPEDLLIFVDQDMQSDPGAFTTSTQSEPPSYIPLMPMTPAYSVAFNGLWRAIVYAGLSPEDFGLEPLDITSLRTTFGTNLELVEARIRPAVWPDKILLASTWRLIEPVDYQLQLQLFDESGELWINQEFPLLNESDHPSGVWPANEDQVASHSLPIAPDLPPGTYELRAQLFDERGIGLGVFDAGGAFQGTSARIAEIIIDSPPYQPQLDIPNPLNQGIELEGYGDLPPAAETGRALTLDIWWRPAPETPDSTALRLTLGPSILLAPIKGQGLQDGFTYHLRPAWLVPAELSSGTYPVSIQLLGDQGQPLWPDEVMIGQIDIESPVRQYDLPEGLEPLGVRLGSLALLQDAEAVLAGDVIEVPLMWQALEPDLADYVVFVHIKEGANILDQDDRQPVIGTGNWVPEQVIEDQHQLTRPAPGRYEIAIGLYDPRNGVRLSMVDADGRSLPEDQYVIKIQIP